MKGGDGGGSARACSLYALLRRVSRLVQGRCPNPSDRKSCVRAPWRSLFLRACSLCALASLTAPAAPTAGALALQPPKMFLGRSHAWETLDLSQIVVDETLDLSQYAQTLTLALALSLILTSILQVRRLPPSARRSYPPTSTHSCTCPASACGLSGARSAGNQARTVVPTLVAPGWCVGHMQTHAREHSARRSCARAP